VTKDHRVSRFAIVSLGLMVAAVGCTIKPKGGSGGSAGEGGQGGSGGAGGAGECEAKVTCDDCRVCASNGPCADELAACAANSACVAIDQCVTFLCDGTAAECLESCQAQNPSGSGVYNAARGCVECDACFGPCGSELICG
jgi:hypothetical protein